MSGRSSQNSHWALWLLCAVLFSGLVKAAPHPVAISGNIQSVYSEFTDLDNNNESASWTNIFTIGANTYIWHPWFALVGGSLSLSNSQAQADKFPEIESEAIGGSFNFLLFPTSRFPFTLSASEQRFKLDSRVSGSSFTQRTWSLRQLYSTWDNKQRYIANYQRRSRSIPGENRATSELFTLGSGFQLTNHKISANLGYSEAVQRGEEDENDATFVTTHAYTGSKTTSFQNRFSATESNNAFSSTTTQLITRQFTSSTAWSPEDNRNLSVSGNIRLDRKSQTLSTLNQTGFLNTDNSQESANLNQGLAYAITRNLNFTESLNVNDTRSGGLRQTTASESLGLDYAPDVIETSAGLYSWFTSASYSYQHGKNIDSSQSFNSQIGHNLSKELVFSPDLSLTSSVAQNVSYTNTLEGEWTGGLGHSAALGWTDSINGDDISARASISDSRGLNDSDFVNQLFNANFNYNVRRDRYTSISTDISYQQTRFKSPSTRSSSATESLTAQIGYSDSKFMNVSSLVFSSTLSLARGNTLTPGALTTEDEDPESLSWTNELNYRIGLFESRMTLDYIKDRESENRTITIELTRNFGAP